VELAMKKQISAVLAAGLIAAMIPAQSFATIAPPVIVPPVVTPPPAPPPPSTPPAAHGGGGGSGGVGAGAAAGIIGVATFLAIYDLVRRTTCSGDFLYLGGPGFTEPMVRGNVLIPQCQAVLHNGKRRKHKAS